MPFLNMPYDNEPVVVTFRGGLRLLVGGRAERQAWHARLEDGALGSPQKAALAALDWVTQICPREGLQPSRPLAETLAFMLATDGGGVMWANEIT